ncbi:MAG: amidohydrolase family protein [Deltaproteobacteria bacterium]|nr:amidohydrolase family protein [Candidatus Anaeroferrophillacea bacterium]
MREIVVPAFVDTHVHLTLGGEPMENARRQWEAGIGLVRDAGDRDDILAGIDCAPLEVVRTGPAIFRPGAYGRFIGDNRDLPAVAKIAGGPWPFVKILLTGVVSFAEYGRIGPRQWDDDEFRALVAAARRAGRRVVVHANGDEACRLAATAGVDNIEHGYFISRETLAIMAERGVCWTPTITAMANQLADPDGRFSAAERAIIDRNYRRQVEMLAAAWELGTPLAPGTDSGSYNVPHGASFFAELGWYLEAGIPAAELLELTTTRGWERLGRPVSRRLRLDLDRFPASGCVRGDFSGDSAACT